MTAPHVPGVPRPEEMTRRDYFARLAAMDTGLDKLEPGTPEFSDAWHDRMGFAANWAEAAAHEPFHGLRERAREFGRRLAGPENEAEAG